MDKNLNVGTEQKTKQSKIPGFRSGKLWKKMIASSLYFFMFFLLLGIVFGDHDNTSEQTNNNKYSEIANQQMSEEEINRLSSYVRLIKGATFITEASLTQNNVTIIYGDYEEYKALNKKSNLTEQDYLQY